MIRLKQAVIVEGKYDKIKLENMLDAVIVTTGGFAVFKDREKLDLIRALANKSGVIIMTDSDSAGNLIRRHLKGFLPPQSIINVYVPQIAGQEKRKRTPSKEGFLGVEGLTEQVLADALERAGVTGEKTSVKAAGVTKAEMYEAGLSGRENSCQNRRNFLRRYGFPENLTGNALLEILNHYYGREEALRMLRENS